MIPFMTSDNEFFYTSDGKKFLVRNHVKNHAVLTSIQVSHQPNKTTYTVGDVFDPTGLVITITYTNKGVTTTREVSQYIFPDATLVAGQTSVNVTVQYLDYQTSIIPISITVVEPQITLTVTTPPNKTQYYLGDTFNPTGMVITATIIDGDGTHTQIVNNYTYDGETILTTSDSYSTINWTYMAPYAASVNVPITVSLPTVNLIVQTQPVKTAYNENDYFTPAGMTVYAEIIKGNNTETQLVTDYTYSPTSALTLSDTVVTLSWTYLSTVTATTTVNISVMRPYATISVTTPPTKTLYEVTDLFESAGMIVTAAITDCDGTTYQTVSDYTSPVDPLTANDTTATISWIYNGTTVTATTPIAVRTYNLTNRPFNSTGSDHMTTSALHMDESFTIGIKLDQDSIGSNGTVFSNIRIGQNDYGIRLGTVNGVYKLTWGTDQTLTFMPNNQQIVAAIMIEHVINTHTLLISYNNLTTMGTTTLTNNNTITINNFDTCLGAGLNSSGNPDTNNIGNDFTGHIIDFSIFNNTIPSRADVNEYLGLSSNTSGCITFSSPNSFSLQTRTPGTYWNGFIEYSNNGIGWYTWNGTSINSRYLNGSHKIMMRGYNNTYISPVDITQSTLSDVSMNTHPASWIFNGTNISISGNIAVLLNYNTVLANSIPTMEVQAFMGLFATNNAITNINELILPFNTLTAYCYYCMFGWCSSLTNTPNLPAMNLAKYCYYGMFWYCYALSQVPELPAMNLAERCYSSMFIRCTNIIGLNILPATTLAPNCYSYMFDGCSAFITPPILPATTLADNCYSNMFQETNISIAPALPATTLAYYCYGGMFNSCTSLTIAPELPATTMASNCYTWMFSGCTSLTTAPALPATTLADSCYYYMFNNCTSLITAPNLPATNIPNFAYHHMFEGCTSLTNPPTLSGVTIGGNSYSYMFKNCSSLINPPILSATTISGPECYQYMFQNCTSLISLPDLPATTLTNNCYKSMFSGCTKIKLSTTQIGEYQQPYQIPSSGTGTNGTNSLLDMFTGTGGTFTGTPTINTTYYLPNNTFITLSSPNSFTLATQDGSKYWNGTIEYSTNNQTWTTWTGASISSGARNNQYELLLRGTGNTTLTGTTSSNDYISTTAPNYQWNITGSNVTLSGDIRNIMDYTNIVTTIPTNACFMWIFRNNTALINIDQFQLPYTTLKQNCYRGLFYGCSNLISAKITLPGGDGQYSHRYMFGECSSLINPPCITAITLGSSYVYQYMFYNCTSLVTPPVLPATTLVQNCYQYMFSGCTALITAPQLPATTLTNSCYNYMFYNCTSLTTPPELLATSLKDSCYNSMFYGCTSLTTTPALLATTLAQSCYNSMFRGCTSLTTAPELPATTLMQTCYYYMFYGCSALTTAPELPAMTLTQSCYDSMFMNCTSLVTPPILPATTLAISCYSNMFNGCTSLKTAPALPATTLATQCYSSMFRNCSNLENLPELPALELLNSCYYWMFQYCSKIKLSATQTGEYQIPYRIPTEGTGTAPGTNTLTLMFGSTGGTFTGTPVINTTYYLSSTNTIAYPYITLSSSSNFSLKVKNETKNWNGTIEYSTNGYVWTIWDGTTTLNSGLLNGKQQLLLRGKNNTTLTNINSAINDTNINTNWEITGSNISIDGNLIDLLDCTNTITSINPYCFYGLFKDNSSLIDITQLISLDTLTNYCYSYMFENCTNLLKTIDLPVEELTTGCYKGMFKGCTKLGTISNLTSSTLAESCYANMFEDCSSIIEPIELNATVLPNYCYEAMFKGTSVNISSSDINNYTKIYKIPSNTTATSVGINALSNMFTNTQGTFVGSPNANTNYYLYEDTYFNITSPTNFTLCTRNNSKNWTGTLEYSTDKQNWYEWVGTTVLSKEYNNKHIIFLRGTNNVRLQSITSVTSSGTGDSSYFPDSWIFNGNNISLNGSIATLLDYTSPPIELTSSYTKSFSYLFKYNTSLISIKNLKFPFTILAQDCFERLFLGCSNLIDVPVLEATTLASSCYRSMFEGCTKIITAPALPATTLAGSCYSYMFYGCTSLASAPILSANELTNSCYSYMFYGCTALTTPPALPATTIASNCYYYMFANCTALLTAPQLPAMTLANYCYQYMFQGCTALTVPPALSATTLAQSCYSYMFQNSGIIIAPDLPATTLAPSCYYEMFYSCKQLTTAPSILPATTLTTSCYAWMFEYCSKLENAPILPATTLAQSCYQYMFYNCTSLKTPPDLPATTLASSCYARMFHNCSNLEKLPLLPATTLPASCYSQMFQGCTKIKISETQTGEYQVPYRIPCSGTGTSQSSSFTDMFKSTGGTFTGNPTVNTTYYIPDSGQSHITFESETAFSLQTSGGGKYWDGTLEYSTDRLNWTIWNGTEINSNILDGKQILCIRGSNNTYISPYDISQSTPSITSSKLNNHTAKWQFTGTNINIIGNIATLLDYTTVLTNSLPTMEVQAFVGLFATNNSIVNANKLTLPFNTLTAYCYDGMFCYCQSLIQAPKLPATTLAKYCYAYMFFSCLQLLTAPELPAMTLTEYCYDHMFPQCYALTAAPELPATTLASNCYAYMFNVCKFTTPPSLPATTLAYRCYYRMFHGADITTAPALPATTLAISCYEEMFYGTDITTAPLLPATSLTEGCYRNMFSSCYSLTTLPTLPVTTLVSACYYGMFNNCGLIKLSTTQTGEYQNTYRIPTSGTGTTVTDALTDMFINTGGTFTGTPTINTIYYTSNTIIS